jgi:hypothetical protein
LLLAAFLHTLGIPLIVVALVLVGGVVLWVAFRHPTGILGAFLAFMPIFPMAFTLGEYFGPHWMALAPGSIKVLLFLLIFTLWRRNGIKLIVTDWFLLACFGLAVVRLAFGGALLALESDLSLMIAYAAGRVAALSADQEKLWARRAVWIVAVLSVLGLSEIFVFGEGPRTILYLAVAEGATETGALNASFHADGYSGLRESATMFGPLTFASLCMVALIVWWVYCRNPLPAGMIAVGLVCSITRSGWLGTALAIPFLAVVMEQKKRFVLYAGLTLVVFVASVPLLGLGDYLFSTKTGQDPSAQGHQESIFQGLEYVSDHPFGSGPGSAGPYATKSSSNGVFIENTYLTLAAQYGIPTGLCFLGFLFSALRVLWRERTQRGYAAIGVLVGFGTVMMVAPLHQDFPLQSWIWFPIGLAIRSSTTGSVSQGHV